MSPEDEKKIADRLNELNQDVELECLVTDDPRTDTIREFCGFLEQGSGHVKIKRISEDGIPCIRVGRVRFQMAPSGLEIEPFFKFIADPDSLAVDTPVAVAGILKNMTFPANLKIYVLPGCTFCPTVVEQVLGLAALSPEIKPVVIDGSLFPELVEKDRIKSAPTIILDDQFRWSGAVNLEELAGFILNRDPSDLSASSLRGIIEDGRADDLARMMLENRRVFPEYEKLLIHDKWPVRLGAMVVFETMAEANSELTAGTVHFLWNAFQEADDTVRGDILYLLGVSGINQVIPNIETVLKGEYSEDVMEAAREALERYQ